MTYVQHLASGPTELDRVYGLRRDYYLLFMEDYNRSIERVDPTLIELCRLRMGTLLNSRLDLSLRYKPAIEAGLTEAKLRDLSNYPHSPVFTDAERRCLDFAEQFVIQSSGIGDDDVARVKEIMDDTDFIYFVKALSVLDQLARGCAAFDIHPSSLVPTCLDKFQAAPGTVQ